MTTKVLQQSPASVYVATPLLVPDWGTWDDEAWVVENLMAGSGAGTESPAEATPDKVPSASKQNQATTNPLAAILGYEYVPG